MPKIVVKRKAEVYKEVPIRPFQNRISVGSEGDNDLILADKKVSMHHLLIERDGDNYYVQDTDSAFGTFVNGTRIDSRTLLSNGDEIVLGEHTLLFENMSERGGNGNGAGSEVEDVKVEDDAVVEEASEKIASHTVLKPVDSQIKKGDKRTGYYLLAIYGPYAGKKYHLNPDITKIGRDKTLNDIVIRENGKGEIDPSISRRHATIFFDNNELYISDKRSKTRTRVNQQILDEDSVLKLYPGDEIEIRSDQKSTIFRLIAGDEVDYRPPRKAGDWWIRNSTMVLHVGSAVVLAIAMVILFSSWKMLSTLWQHPDKLQLKQVTWHEESDPLGGYRQAEEVRQLMPSMTPAIGDLNGDGFNDMVYSDKLGYLFAVDGESKQPIWKATEHYRIQFPLSFVMTDLNGNNLPDIILPSNDSRLYAIDGKTGTEIWSSPLIGGVLSGPPAVADINGDGKLDIFFSSIRGDVYIGYGTFGEPKWSNNQTGAKIRCTPAAGDFNGDGIAEIVVGTDAGQLMIFNGMTNNFESIVDVNEEFQKAKGSFFEDHQIRGQFSVGDLDGDHRDDVVLMTANGHILAMSINPLKRLWYDEMVAAETLDGTMIGMTALGDLDGDQSQDVVVFTADNKILAYRGTGLGNGNKKILWGMMPDDGEEFISRPVLSDMNKDGYADVIAAGFYNGLYILNGQNGKVLWQENNQNHKAICSTPLVADMHADKSTDLLVRKVDEKFYLNSCNSLIPASFIWWGQINKDASQSANYHITGLNGTQPVVLLIIALLVIAATVSVNVLLIMKRKKLYTI